MNTYWINRITTRTFLKAAATVGSLLMLFTIPHFGQRATSRDDLATIGYLTKGEISDDLDGTDDECFYKFAASPGKLTITLEVTANKTNAGAMLDLIGPNSKPILSNMLAQAANGGSEQMFTTVNISKKQDVIIRIKGLRYGSSAGYPGTYKIVIEGPAVAFDDVEASGGAGENDTPSNDTDQNKKTGATQTGEGGKGKKTSKVDSAIDKAKNESSKWLDLVDKAKKTKP